MILLFLSKIQTQNFFLSKKVSIESTGIYHPKEIFKRAISVLQGKAESIINEVSEYENTLMEDK